VRICGNSNSGPANLNFEKDASVPRELIIFFARDTPTIIIFFTGNTGDGRDEVIVRQEGCTQGSCCEGHKVIW
jgi:hypothetical protein